MSPLKKPIAYVVYPGGLLRCCTSTLRDLMYRFEYSEPKDGQVFDCEHCKPGNKNIVYKSFEKSWQWNKPNE